MEPIFEKEWITQFRDADTDCCVGLRGYMFYFQEMFGGYVEKLEKGIGHIRPRYGAVWMYTKFRVTLLKKVPFGLPLTMKLWLEQQRSTIRVNAIFEVYHGEEPVFRGRLEACVVKPETGSICKMEEIEFPLELLRKEKSPVPGFSRLPKQLPGGEKVSQHLVQYTDLDLNHHMNNQLYVNLFLNGFDWEFWQAHPVKGFELHYLAQSYEKELLTVVAQQQENGCQMAAQKPDGTVAATAWFEF